MRVWYVIVKYKLKNNHNMTSPADMIKPFLVTLYNKIPVVNISKYISIYFNYIIQITSCIY